jgi:hypothetical protein
MHRTPSSTGNRKTFTSSFWVKLGKLGVNTQLPMPGVTHGVGSSGISLTTANVLNAYIYYSGSWSGLLVGTRVFRDPSAWYHFVIVVDTTQAVANERIRIYVNGQRENNFSSEAYPSLNTDTDWNLSGEKMWIGIDPSGSGYNGEYYASEMVYIDGTAYGPENFGETNDSGIWVPKDVSELTFGTNGFWIDGRDSAALGDDEAGSNDCTTSGLAAHDQVSDSPTNNFAVLNPVDTYGKLAGEIRNGNLELKDNSASVYVHGRATFGFDVTDSDGFYWESCDVVDGSGIGGICEDNAVIPSGSTTGFTGARGANSINSNNWYKLDGTTYYSTSLGVSSNAGDIAQFCVKNGKLFIGVNGTYVLSGNPATEANPLFTGLTGIFMPFGGLYSGYSYNTVYNFGQDGTFAGNKTAQGNTDANGYGNFFYAPPSGAKALCSKSLGS